jgi:hypothetical protein
VAGLGPSFTCTSRDVSGQRSTFMKGVSVRDRVYPGNVDRWRMRTVEKYTPRDSVFICKEFQVNEGVKDEAPLSLITIPVLRDRRLRTML